MSPHCEKNQPRLDAPAELEQTSTRGKIWRRTHAHLCTIRRHADMQTCGHADMRTCGHADMQTCRHTDIHNASRACDNSTVHTPFCLTGADISAPSLCESWRRFPKQNDAARGTRCKTSSSRHSKQLAPLNWSLHASSPPSSPPNVCWL